MGVYIYAADIYCEDCGEAIRKRLKVEGFEWHDEEGFNTDDYPAGPYPDGGGEADCPQHCGAGSDCLNAIHVPVEGHRGFKIGAWLENELTTVGVKYVQEAIREGDYVAKLWAEWYRDYDLQPVIKGS